MTTCSVREDKVCPPSLSKSSDEDCDQTGTHFHCYNLQKHLYVVICIFYLQHEYVHVICRASILLNVAWLFVESVAAKSYWR